MKKFLVFTLLTLIMVSWNIDNGIDIPENPLLVKYDTPFEVPPFDLIQPEHFVPAFKAGIEQQKAEINAIITNPAVPDFENTIVPLDQSGEILRNASVFYSLNSANTNPTLQKIARELTPMMSAHRNEIGLNQDLFNRIKAVYDKRESLGLDAEQMRVVESTYRDFERNGAALPEEKRNELKKINEQLAMLTLKYGENLLAENNGFRLIIDNKEDLAGLPEDIIGAAADQAKNDNMEGKWVFTLQKPSWIPFLTYSPKRELREKIYKAYLSMGNNNNDYDNKTLITQLVKLRDQRAKLLGYTNFAEFSIDDNMAKTPQNVYDFLNKIWEPSLMMAKNEVVEMQKIIDKEGGNFKLESWDWWYYAEKVRKAKYDLDAEALKPYFKLDDVRDGIFYVANKLYGLKFIQNKNIPVYHEEVQAFEVQESDGTHLAVLYIDSHPRPGKRSGAWCGAVRSGAYENGKKITPVVYIVTNFTRPTGDTPALLSWDETTTYFHEFGHALHNFFADGHYRRTSRDVPRDYVELPSQIMENWAGEPEVLKMYAKHYKTGEVIPDELIQKIQNSGQFNQGFETVEYVAASLLDLDYHTTANVENLDVLAFEKASMDKIGLIPEILPRYRSTYFQHIFSGGYSAGYYVYLWAAVLDSDAFNAFKESGDIFNPELAAKFRKYCLAENAMGEGMDQYRKFRGQEPSIEPLLKKRGLK
ncbi:MAG: peptidase M3 [Bacteroidetes bacterium GWC2_33_15]|nr:MAG: peptidase M3 [Bacteroidetes bacterium GWA2_33_15]OFX52273.1 MAG: peptidase M3 [Bacteroidetes bacterium GWC2_33_15]OFX64427.1 MAG: peptidase M3 [Bacteroidetes bacterium GWB2_32_14]OFX67832.1 MAG: peptidase M3 [Bacteroidetes bacterium GWD2_33_33]HAN19448.1 peptidase M3 [Bacteroidales bacterium]